MENGTENGMNYKNGTGNGSAGGMENGPTLTASNLLLLEKLLEGPFKYYVRDLRLGGGWRKTDEL